ncbi:Uncharacterised protein [Vibrio cholerae]|nr:Uncharacterised protein [Vibrio cholerae]
MSQGNSARTWAFLSFSKVRGEELADDSLLLS